MQPQYYMMIYKISGTDPHKETQMFLRMSSIDHFKSNMAKNIQYIYSMILDYDDPEDEDVNKSIRYYQSELNQWMGFLDKSQINHLDDLEQFDHDLYVLSKSMEKHYGTKIHQGFNEPNNATLITIDSITSYDFHYYIGWQQIPVNNEDLVEWIVHEH